MRNLRLISAFLAAFTFGAMTASPASAITYDRLSAKTYAEQFACNGSDCANPAFYRWPADCTNFASQTVHAGGYPMRYSTVDGWFYDSDYLHGINMLNTDSWTSVTWFRDFTVSYAKRAVYYETDESSPYSPAEIGDLIMYNWKSGDGFTHLSVFTGTGSYNAYLDPESGKKYNTANGGQGDYINQHTTDRKHAPWNWGYYIATPEKRALMRFVVIHFLG